MAKGDILIFNEEDDPRRKNEGFNKLLKYFKDEYYKRLEKLKSEVNKMENTIDLTYDSKGKPHFESWTNKTYPKNYYKEKK